MLFHTETMGRELYSPCAHVAVRLHLVMVRLLIHLTESGSEKKPLENTSWKIRRNGITVMAVVVLRTRQETRRLNMSAAKIDRKTVTPRSIKMLLEKIPVSGNLTFIWLNTNSVMMV